VVRFKVSFGPVAYGEEKIEAIPAKGRQGIWYAEIREDKTE